MSTYLYLQCIAHDPPITASAESGQHLYDLDRLREELAHREVYAKASKAGATFNDQYTNATAHFLSEHPLCPLKIVDEYGTFHPIVKDEEK